MRLVVSWKCISSVLRASLDKEEVAREEGVSALRRICPPKRIWTDDGDLSMRKTQPQEEPQQKRAASGFCRPNVPTHLGFSWGSGLVPFQMVTVSGFSGYKRRWWSMLVHRYVEVGWREYPLMSYVYATNVDSIDSKNLLHLTTMAISKRFRRRVRSVEQLSWWKGPYTHRRASSDKSGVFVVENPSAPHCIIYNCYFFTRDGVVFGRTTFFDRGVMTWACTRCYACRRERNGMEREVHPEPDGRRALTAFILRGTHAA